MIDTILECREDKVALMRFSHLWRYLFVPGLLLQNRQTVSEYVRGSLTDGVRREQEDERKFVLIDPIEPALYQEVR